MPKRKQRNEGCILRSHYIVNKRRTNSFFTEKSLSPVSGSVTCYTYSNVIGSLSKFNQMQSKVEGLLFSYSEWVFFFSYILDAWISLVFIKSIDLVFGKTRKV